MTDLTILKSETLIATRNGQLFVSNVTPIRESWIEGPNACVPLKGNSGDFFMSTDLRILLNFKDWLQLDDFLLATLCL